MSYERNHPERRQQAKKGAEKSPKKAFEPNIAMIRGGVLTAELLMFQPTSVVTIYFSLTLNLESWTLQVLGAGF